MPKRLSPDPAPGNRRQLTVADVARAARSAEVSPGQMLDELLDAAERDELEVFDIEAGPVFTYPGFGLIQVSGAVDLYLSKSEALEMSAALANAVQRSDSKDAHRFVMTSKRGRWHSVNPRTIRIAR